MSVRYLLLLFCSINLAFSQSPGARTKAKLKTSDKAEPATTSDNISPPDYGAIIDKIQNDLNTLSSYSTDISNFKQQLSEVNNKITKYSQKQSDINTIENHIDLTNKVINKLSSRIETIETDINKMNTATDDTSYDIINNNINSINKDMNKLSSSMSREISDNTNRLEVIEENTNEYDTKIENIKKELKKLSINIEKSEKKYDNTFKQIRDRFDKIDKSISDTNKNLQIVYDSTVGAAMDKLISNILDYLADFGEFCVNIVEKIKNKIMSINWKGYYDEITDPNQQKLFKDWLYGIYKYVSFWWFNGIQPAIIRQVTNLYFGGQMFVKESIKSMHNSFVYEELMKQMEPYLKMGNISMEYNGYIIDGLLVLFFISSLITLSFIIGLCCDCCCPLKVVVVEQKVQMNGRHQNDHRKKKKKKYRKHI